MISPSPDAVSTLDDRIAALRLALDDACLQARRAAVSPDVRERLKQEIITLFREADAGVAAAQVIKESVKGLADQWKLLEHPGAAAMASATRGGAGSARVDHLGASTFVEKGWSRLSLGDAAGAEASLRKALELAPGNNEAESLLGWAQMMQEQYDHALLTFHNVLMRDPQNTLARTNVGYICLRKRIYGEAIEHLSNAIRLDRDKKATLYAHLYLGMVYREREMYDDADAFFRKALELGPNLLQAWYELGRSCWFSGRRDDAIAAWRSGAEANKFSPWGKRCAELLTVVEQGGEPPRGD
jgi:tetratricopeptide (TPR) repeat protein